MVLSLLIYIAQESSKNEVLISAVTYCDGIFSDPLEAKTVAWNDPDECAWELAELHSLPDPKYIIDRIEDESRFISGWEPEKIDSYLETLRKHYPAFALLSPPSLDAKLMYDPTVPNPWRMVTSSLAHADWWHVIGNLIGMYLMQEQRDEYRDELDEEVVFQREKRSGLPGINTKDLGNYKKVTERKQMQAAEEQYESRMEEIYTSVRSENDSTAIMLLLNDYELWAESSEVYEEIFNRMHQWGYSRALMCIGRLAIHLNAKRGHTARAQQIASKCLDLDPKFTLADRLDLGNMFQGSTDTQGEALAQLLHENSG